MSDLSLHIDCTYRWDEAKHFIASPHVHTAFLMNASAEQVQYALKHCDLVVVRVYDPFNELRSLGEDFEKSIVNRRKGHEFVHWLNNSPFQQFKNNPKLRFVLGWNELYSKRGQAERTQNKNIVAIGQALVDAGYGVGLGAWAADKSFYADDVNAGHWDEVVRFAVQHRDMVSIEIHEYDVLTIFAGHLKQYPDGFPDTLKTAIALDPDNHAKIPYSRDEGNIETNYKIGRIALLLQRALDMFTKAFFWYRGECALDFKDDGALKQLMDNWYKPQFGQPTGVNSLLNYYRHVLGRDLTEKAYDDLIFKQHVGLVEQDPDSCQANFIFAWNGDHPRWLPFDVAQRPYFVSMVANYESGTVSEPAPPPQPEPTPDYIEGVDYDMVSAVLTTLKSTNIRKERNTTFEPDIVLYKGDELPVKMSDKPLWAGSGFMWYRLLLNDEIFYVAKDNNLLIDETDIPDTTPEPTPDEPVIDNEVVKGMIARLDAQDRVIDALTSQIAELLESFEPVQIDFVHTTLEAPRILQKPIGLAFVDIAKELQAWGYRYAGIVTASQIADEIYSTTTPDMSMDGMLTDEIMNGGDEDDLPLAGKKFGISEFT